MNDETSISNAAPVHAPLTRWDRNFKRNVAVGMILTGLLLIYLSRAVIATLIMAAILAYLIHPMVNRLMHLRLPRGLVTGLVYLFVVLLLIFVPIILIPVLIEQIST
ncbi:MAG: hypothetical protein WAV60_07480, partial [Anaerolineae bacterium]